MAYPYNEDILSNQLHSLIRKNLNQEAFEWLEKQYQRYTSEYKTSVFNFTFAAIPRFVNKGKLVLSDEEEVALQKIRSKLEIANWGIAQLVRVWWLLQLPVEDEEKYVTHITSLFMAAEMKEQVALYGSLPLLAYPKRFVKQAVSGLRTNIGIVFDAIVLHNPFPSENMEESAWNQLVLKAFFMERCVNNIIGLDERSNKALAYILSDYAHERWAAGRTVDPLLWRPVAPFIDEKLFPDIQRLFQSEGKEKQAGALACFYSSYQPAQILLEKHTELKNQIEQNQLHWESLGSSENE